MVTIYTITYNEEVFIGYFINHYRKNFPNCNIIIYDNYSTDKTVEIAKKNNCEVIFFDTNNQINDNEYLKIKNNCWKDSKTDWVIVCDCDELLDINLEELKFEINKNTNIIKTEGYSMMNLNDNFDFKLINKGFRDENSDKLVLFNKNSVLEINYQSGAHKCNPKLKDGIIKYSEKHYRLFHYKFLGLNYLFNKHKMYHKRLSEENIRNGWGFHYSWSYEELKDYYDQRKKYLIELF